MNPTIDQMKIAVKGNYYSSEKTCIGMLDYLRKVGTPWDASVVNVFILKNVRVL